MSSRLLLLPLLLVVSGCADVLGLDGLTYDKKPTPVVSSTGGEGGAEAGPEEAGFGDGDGDIRVGGVPNPSTPDTTGLLLDPLALVAASPSLGESGSFFFVYEPSTEELSLRARRGSDSELLDSWQWPAPHGATHLAVIPGEARVTLALYDAGSGYFSQAAVEDGEFAILHTTTGTAQRAALVPFYTGSEWLLYAYSNDEDGNYRFLRPLPTEEPAAYSGESEPGWASIDRFEFEGDHGLIKLNAETNTLAFDRFVSLEEPLERVFTLTLGESFSKVASFSLSGEAPYRQLLLYKSGSGRVVRASLEEGTTGVAFTIHDDSYFRADLNQIAPLFEDAPAHALTFSPLSARLNIRVLSPLDEVFVPVVK